jgi:transposase InsO family protein
MPWRETSPVHERQRFVVDAEYARLSFSELCRRYRISRKTGYKWLERYAAGGLSALHDRSHRPGSCPHATRPKVIEAVLRLRKRWKWGAPKLRELLGAELPSAEVPAVATIHRILVRHGRVRKRRRSRQRPHPGRPTTAITRPNAIWSADFKGQFRTGDGHYCYPLTVQDAYSRYLLACQGLAGTQRQPARAVFTRLFHEFGLPERIRTDNGQPFATCALGRLSALSVWWVQLGILPELIEPAHPEQNGRHERMHRTLKAETARPPAASCVAQQRRFNAFREIYNEHRPHEALGQQVPARHYQPSPRAVPARLEPLTYPGHFEIRRVSTNGGIRWHNRWVNVSHVLGTLNIGLEPIADGTWNVFFGPLHLGWFDERDYQIHDHRGRLKRRRRL